MSALAPAYSVPELMLHQLSFLRMQDLWSLQQTCCLNRTSVQTYLRSKFSCYLSRVLCNASGMPICMIYLCPLTDFYIDSNVDQMTLNNNLRMLFCLLDLSDAIITGEFAVAMMADEYEAHNWAFDSLKIIVSTNSASLLENFFRETHYIWRIATDDSINAAPNAPHEEVLDFMQNTLPLFSDSNSTSLQGQTSTGIELVICRVDKAMEHIANAPSTAFSSFITPSGFFCAYPQMTLTHYAIATNRFPTSASLRLHALFGYKMHITNKFWQEPCGARCPSLYRRIPTTFAVIPLRENGSMCWLDSYLLWRIRANCLNTYCPHRGYYLT